MKKRYITIVVIVCLFVAIFFMGLTKEKYFLFKSGKTDYKIVISEDAGTTLIYAANKLSSLLEQISGAEFPVETDAQPITSKEIVIGATRRSVKVPVKASSFINSKDGFAVFNNKSTLYIIGGSQRGVLYGVYDFLEKQLGCRWFTSDVKKIPNMDFWAFDAVSIFNKPAIKYRAVDYMEAYLHEFSVPRKINSQRFIRSNQPGGYERFWLEHSFDIFVSAEVYFQSHPEYFSLIDGRRQSENTQLCLSNPEVYKILKKKLKLFISNNPDYRIYNVAQNDNKNPCLCNRCRSLADEYGGQSGLMLWFVNRIARNIKEYYPNKLIGTFAYQYTRKPPVNIVPEENVFIILCSIECDFSHPISHSNNQEFLDDLRNWSKLTSNIFIWDYVVNYRHYLLPHPNFAVLQENIRIFDKYNVKGVLEQANYQSYGSEFSWLRSYILSKLLWDPEINQRKNIEEFIYSYYGLSAEYILQYFDLVQSMVTEDSEIYFDTKVSNEIYSENFLQHASAIIKKAEDIAENVKVLHRVKLTGLGILYLKILNNPKLAVESGLLDSFLKTAQTANITMTSEGTTLEEFEKKVKYLSENN